jgi:hypothetical protein
MPEDFETIEQMEAEAKPGRTGEPHGDDSLMGRFDRWGLTRFSAWDAVKATTLTAILLLIFAGGSVREAADELDPGIGRDVVVAVGKPAGWISDRLPLADTRRDLTSWLSPDTELGEGSFETNAGATSAAQGRSSPVASEQGQVLETLLITGDSLSTPLDIELARDLADRDGEVIRDPHLATGISNAGLVDWGQLSTGQVSEHHPDATVVFIGANEGYPMDGPNSTVNCCGPDWEAEFASRVGQMMDNYLQEGAARVYWLTIPTQRDPDRLPIEQAVNRAIKAAAAERGDAVRVIDTVPTFTPGDRYRDAIEIDGQETIVRESDGIHLNETGSALAAEIVLDAIDRDFGR